MNVAPSFRFWLGWTLVHAGVMGAGHLLLAWALKMPAMFSPYATALVLAFVQPLLLGRRVRWVWLWPMCAALGGALTFVVNWYFPILLGLVIGLLQWPLLAAGQFRRTMFWPLLGGAAWAGAFYAGWFVIAQLVGASLAQTPHGSGPLPASVVLAFVGLCHGAATGGALMLMRPVLSGSAGRLFYDGACPFCQRWVKRCGFVARQGGFALLTLQSDEARRDLGLAAGELPLVMKLRLANGRVLGGVDAVIVLAEAGDWTAPLGWLLRLPGLNALAWRGYRWIAANRYCFGGRCVIPLKLEPGGTP